MAGLWLLLSRAFAHSGAVPVRGQYDWSHLPDAEPGVWVVWEFYPSIVLGCLAWAAWYVLNCVVQKKRPTNLQAGAFAASLLVVFGALQGPLHELSDLYLFSGHMVQHLLLTLVFPPLFILGIPDWMVQPVARLPGVAAFGRAITHPLVAGLFATFTLYVWHIPSMYDWALFDHNVHIFEHLTFMFGAVVMWWPVCSTTAEIPPINDSAKMIYLFLLTVPMKALGAVITISDYMIYEFYAGQPRVFGLDPLTDQRLGGLIMWIPAGLIFWGAIAFIFFTRYYTTVSALRQGKPAVAPELPVEGLAAK
jgi:putative membrane protein